MKNKNIYTRLLLLLLTSAATTIASADERYSSAECQSLDKYLLERISEKHGKLAEKIADEIKHSCSLNPKLLSKIAHFIDQREAGPIAARILTLMKAPLDNALRTAAHGQNTETFEYLLDHGADMYIAIDTATGLELPHYIPLLHYVIRKGFTKMANLMIIYGYDVNQPQEGVTPLMMASWYGQNDIVTMLLSRGAQASIRDLNGYTALDYASVGFSYLGWSRLEKNVLKALKEAFDAEK